MEINGRYATYVGTNAYAAVISMYIYGPIRAQYFVTSSSRARNTLEGYREHAENGDIPDASKGKSHVFLFKRFTPIDSDVLASTTTDSWWT